MGVALSLAELEAFDPRPTRQGANDRYCCPLPVCAGKPINRAHQSFAVHRESGAWTCHRCHEKGILIEFRKEGLKPRNYDVVRRSRARRRWDLPPEAPPALPDSEWKKRLRGLLPLTEAASKEGAAYLAGRGISAELAASAGAKFLPRYHGRPAVVFPLKNDAGRSVAAQGRFVDGGEEPKAMTAGPASAGVFATPGAWEAKYPLICEAPIDALSLAAAGFPAFALCGVALRKWLPLCLAWKPAGLAFDADAGGADAVATWRNALEAAGARPFLARPKGAKDWNEYLTRFGVAALRTFIRARLPRPADPPEISAAGRGLLLPFRSLIEAAQRSDLRFFVEVGGVIEDMDYYTVAVAEPIFFGEELENPLLSAWLENLRLMQKRFDAIGSDGLCASCGWRRPKGEGGQLCMDCEAASDSEPFCREDCDEQIIGRIDPGGSLTCINCRIRIRSVLQGLARM